MLLYLALLTNFLTVCDSRCLYATGLARHACLLLIGHNYHDEYVSYDM
jgi:hypothetical protein